MTNLPDAWKDPLLEAYGLLPNQHSVSLFGSGLIHKSYVVKDSVGVPKFLIQQVNHHVFREPETISHNLQLIRSFLDRNVPGYLLITPTNTRKNEPYWKDEEGNYFRMQSFVPDSHTIDACNSPIQAYEAAKAFAGFTAVFRDFPVSDLKDTIPHFHDLSLRVRQFEDALSVGDPERINACRKWTEYLLSRKTIAVRYKQIIGDTTFPKRVIHHDTKISNVLLDQSEKALCIIDLDTVMSGYYISDVGDMMRTYLSAADEEEINFGEVQVRTEYFESILRGYFQLMGVNLTQNEKESFYYSGEFIIYMQALRFMTDHINGDIYYGARYPGHNFNRSLNQIHLLESYIGHYDLFMRLVTSYR